MFLAYARFVPTPRLDGKANRKGCAPTCVVLFRFPI